MQLFPFIDYSTNLYYIQGNVQSQIVKNSSQIITFVIYPGAQNTSISLSDARILGIEYEKLKDANLFWENKIAKIMPNCGIGFYLNDKTGIVEYFEQVIIQDIKPIKIEQHQLVSQLPSILGKDFLSR